MDKEISYENVDNSFSYKKPWRHSPHATVTYSLCGIKKKKGLLSQQYQKEKAHNFKSLSVQAQKKVLQQQDQDLCIHMTLTWELHSQFSEKEKHQSGRAV